jgi:hypothetical protein
MIFDKRCLPIKQMATYQSLSRKSVFGDAANRFDNNHIRNNESLRLTILIFLYSS